MIKKLINITTILLALAGMVGTAQAALTTIGTATYGASNYKLIWDDDNNGNSIIWLDYTNSSNTWAAQTDWVNGLDSQLTNINTPGYTISWIDQAWRLPNTVNGPNVHGYEGEQPPGSGNYNYTAGYNLANSEMGHLYYKELGNLGYVATDGTEPQPGWGLQNTGDFDNLIASLYWSGTTCTSSYGWAWFFSMNGGGQGDNNKGHNGYGLAVRSANVSAVPIPGAAWLLGSGLMGLASLRKLKQRNRR